MLLNKERFLDEICEIAIDGSRMGVVDNRPVGCAYTNCNDCLFSGFNKCLDECREWLNKEYIREAEFYSEDGNLWDNKNETSYKYKMVCNLAECSRGDKVLVYNGVGFVEREFLIKDEAGCFICSNGEYGEHFSECWKIIEPRALSKAIFVSAGNEEWEKVELIKVLYYNDNFVIEIKRGNKIQRYADYYYFDGGLLSYVNKKEATRIDDKIFVKNKDDKYWKLRNTRERDLYDEFYEER